MDAEWIAVTLNDALSALQELVDDVEAAPEAVEEILREGMPSVFAKLNYAWNTRHTSPSAIDTTDHDQLVAWPKDVPGL